MKLRELLIFLSLLSFSLCEIKELQTLDDLKAFKQEDGTVAIFYFKQFSSKPFISRTLNMMKELDEQLEDNADPYVQLGVVNCLLPDIMDSKINECTKKRSFHAYKMKGELRQEYLIKELFNLDAMEAQLLSFVYNDKVLIVQDEKDYEYVITSNQGTNDIILFYTKGYGTKDHHRFLKSVGSERFKNYQFAISTDHKFITDTFGSIINKNFGLFYLLSETSKETKSCPYRQFTGSRYPKFDVLQTFIDSVSEPVIEKIKDDGTTSQPGYIHIVYLIVDTDDDVTKLSQMCTNAIASVSSDEALLRGVLVDVREFSKLEMFGMITKDMLPTVIIELGDRRNSEMKYFEYYPPDQDLNEKNMMKFVDEVVNHLDTYVKKMVDVYSQVTSMKPSEFQQQSDVEYLVASCLTESSSQCSDFQFSFRILSRTLQLNGLVDIEYTYLDHTDQKSGLDTPRITFYSSSKKSEKILDNENQSYDAMLQWFNEIYGSHFASIPASSTDLRPLSLKLIKSDINKMDVSDDLPSLQDDEIRKDVAPMDLIIYRDNVTMVTDKTFNETVAESKLLVVLFYVSYDSRSRLFQLVFADVNNKILQENDGNMQTKLAKVNCESEYNACKYMKLTSYPTVTIFKDGHDVNSYRGLLDETNLMLAIHLYQHPSLVSVTSDTVESFEKGMQPFPYSDVAFLAWFPEENKDFTTFKKVSELYYGKYLFGYVIDASLKSPRVSSYNRKDEVKKARTMQQQQDGFTEEILHTFVGKSAIPTLGAMDMGNFPLYKSQGLPIVTMFTSGPRRLDSDEWKGLVEAAKANTEEVLFVWMDMDDDVTKRIRRNYLGSKGMKQANDIVLVNHAKGVVYSYDMTKQNETSISQWINDCTQGKTRRIFTLSKQQWKPLREGFDFLYFIDNNIGSDDVNVADFVARTNDEAHAKQSEDNVEIYESAGDVNVNGLPDTGQGEDDDDKDFGSEVRIKEEEEELNADEIARQFKHDEF